MKKKIYTALTIVLCLLLTFYVYELVQINYIVRTMQHGQIPHYVLLIDIIWILCSIGAGIGGYFLSKVRWRIVYIQKRHRRNVFKK